MRRQCLEKGNYRFSVHSLAAPPPKSGKFFRIQRHPVLGQGSVRGERRNRRRRRSRFRFLRPFAFLSLNGGGGGGDRLWSEHKITDCPTKPRGEIMEGGRKIRPPPPPPRKMDHLSSNECLLACKHRSATMVLRGGGGGLIFRTQQISGGKEIHQFDKVYLIIRRQTVEEYGEFTPSQPAQKTGTDIFLPLLSPFFPFNQFASERRGERKRPGGRTGVRGGEEGGSLKCSAAAAANSESANPPLTAVSLKG